MLRTQVIKLARSNQLPISRSFTAAAIRAGAGDTGATRSGGSASSDAFNRREAADENLFIRQKEMESLKRLKEKLAAQRKHLDELDKHIEELQKEQGGEQN